MTAQKTISAMGVVASAAAACVFAWSYLRTSDPYDLAGALLLVLTSLLGIGSLRAAAPSQLASFRPEGAKRSIAQFMGFAGACWLILYFRLRGADPSVLLQPLNVFI